MVWVVINLFIYYIYKDCSIISHYFLSFAGDTSSGSGSLLGLWVIAIILLLSTVPNFFLTLLISKQFRKSVTLALPFLKRTPPPVSEFPSNTTKSSHTVSSRRATNGRVKSMS